MRLFEQAYKLKIGDDIGDPSTLDLRFSSIDGRLSTLEDTAHDWQEAVADITQLGLQHINEVLLPAADALLQAVDIGAYFVAASDTEQTAGLGPKIFFLVEADRTRYAPPAYVAVMPDDGSTSPAMFGRVTAFDRPSGQIDIDVDQVAGAGVTFSDWLISPTAPTDNASIAATASGARDLALSYRADAQSYRDGAQSAAGDATTAKNDAQAARTDASTASTAATAARDAAIAAVASQNQYWLGGKLTAPIVDNQGNALVNGAAYVNLADAQLYYRIAGAWTNVVVPVGSEVISVFGRTSSVTAQAGDYDTTQVARIGGAGGIAGNTTELGLVDLKAQIDLKLATAATTAFTRTILDDADAAAVRVTLGLGSAALSAATDFAAAVHGHAWADITSGKPTTIGGYGITDAYTKAQVDNNIAAVVGAAPGALDTLKELADAMGDDPNFATTVTNGLAAKLNASAVSTFALTYLDDTSASAVRATIDAAQTAHAHAIADVTGLQAALDGKQGLATILTNLVGATWANDRFPYFTSATAIAVGTITSAGRALIDDADTAAQRVTLGLRIGTDIQAFSASLTSFGALGSAADKLGYTTALNTWAETAFTAAGRALVDDADAAAQRATLGLGIGTAVQAYDATLTSLALLGTTADRLPYTTGVDTWAEATLSTFMRGHLADAAATNARTTLGVAIGTNVQAYDATLLSIATLGTGADKIAYTTGVDTWAETALSAFMRGHLADAAASNARTTLGLVIGTNVQASDATLLSLATLGTAANKIAYTTGVDTWAEATATAFARARWGRAVTSTASSATPTPNADTDEVYELTAQAAAATFGAPTGTPGDGQQLRIRIKDNGTAQTLAFNAIYRGGTDLALPTTTVLSKTMYLAFIYNAADVKWDYVAQTGNI